MKQAIIAIIVCVFLSFGIAFDSHAKPTKPLITFPPRGRVAPVRVPFKKPCMSKSDYMRRFGGLNNLFGRNTLRYNDCDEDGFDSTRDGGGDCSDYNANVHPGAVEICDGLDNDCNGTADDGLPTHTWYADADNDGYGDPTASTSTCTIAAPAGLVANANDCDDTNNAIHPGAVEVCDNADNDCTGGIDNGIAPIPADNTQGLCASNIKVCHDGDFVNATGNYVPMSEICDGLDNDCAGGTDDGLTNRPASNTQGLCAGNTETCNGIDGWQATATNYTPTAEICDGLDNDCAGGIDNGLADRLTSNQDGECEGNLEHCEAVEGYQPLATNYIPTDEICDNKDNNCNDAVDEGISNIPALNTQGLCSANIRVCSSGTFVDLAANYIPTTEICDGLDNDCAGGIDDGLTDLPATNTNGECVGNKLQCNGVAGWQAKATNYIPTDETCDTLDNNCNGTVDEGLTIYTWYTDADGDGHGNPEISETNCHATFASHVSNADDCNDADSTINPSVAEDTTRIGDENCDGKGIGNLSAADAVFEGDTASDYTGFSMANVGDMDGDNVPDILVGAPSWDASLEPLGTGEAVLLRGNTENFLSLGTELYHAGVHTGDSAGSSVASAGDMNDDGVPDIIIGATTVDGEGLDTGAAYLIYGPYNESVSLSEADFVLTGIAQYDTIGFTLGSAGDYNCDGYDDLFIGGAYNNNGGTNAGEAYVIYGPLDTGTMSMTSADVTIRATEAWSLFGDSGMATDLDRDGCSDLIISAPMAGSTDRGKVYIFKGSETPASLITTATADVIFTGGTDGEEAGGAIAIKKNGDLTGDGNIDLVIGARYNACGGTDSGAVYIVSDPLTSKTLSTLESAFICGDGTGDQLGDYSSSLDIGDLDGDRVYDLLIGDESNGTYYGAATFLFMGPVNGIHDASDANFIFEGQSDVGYASGRSAIFIDDLNSDGFLEIGIGDPNYSNPEVKAGAAYIINGSRLFN
ncbi:MAG: FG-GAP repeat protein [Deltaproteobacteria bacterium]|nr:FG-GAP repeat protein [Deltaproteobacteria bacterium]